MNSRNDITEKDRGFLKIFMFIPGVLLLFNSLDNDIWFLLNHGRYVLTRGIPYIEPFTIHHGLKFVMQQWMSAAVFWIVYSGFGVIGLKILTMLCYMIIIFILYKLCMRISENYFFISYLTCLAVGILLVMFITVRPNIFSTVIIVLELYLLESFVLSGNKRYLYSLPVLSLFMINLHAAIWPFMFVVLIPYVIDSFHFKIGIVSGQGYDKKALLFIICAMLLAGFLNPYGADAMTYLFKSYGYGEIALIDEMKPAAINSAQGLLIYGSLLITILFYSMYRKGTTKLRYILLTIGTAVLMLSSQRGFLFFIICAIFPLTYYFKDLKLPKFENTASKKTMRLRKILIIFIVLLIPLLIYKINSINSETEYKNRLLNDTLNSILKEHRDRVVLYTGFNEGGSAEFLGITAYIDPRAEVFVKKNNGKADIMKEYMMMQTGKLYYKDMLNKYKFTHLLITESDILNTYLKHDKDYIITYSNEGYTLYEPK